MTPRRTFKVVAVLMLVSGCDSNHLPHLEAPLTKADQSYAVARQDEMKDWTTAGILPRVIHRHYFEVPGGANVTVEPERFGFVRPLGNGLLAFLAYANGELIRNIHQEHLDHLEVSIEDANEIALDNLRKIAFDGSTIQQQITRTKTGNDWAVWLGNDFTSSCILLPDFYLWAQNHLRADTFLVPVAATQMVVVLQRKNQDLLPQFDKYIDKVLEDSDNLVLEEWFVLTQRSLTPLADG